MTESTSELLPLQIYARYLDRVRLMAQRYMLVLENADLKEGLREGQAPDADVARRCLFGLELGPERSRVLESLNARLAAAYDAMGPQAAVDSFEELRIDFGLSDRASDALWVLLAPKLSPEFLWLYRTIWGDMERERCSVSFVRHMLDPLGQAVEDVSRVLAPDGPLLGARLVSSLAPPPTPALAISPKLERALLGMNQTPSALPGMVAVHPPSSGETPDRLKFKMTPELLTPIRKAFAQTRRFILVGSESASPLRLATELMSDQGMTLMELDLREMGERPAPALSEHLFEARLRRAALFIDRIETLENASPGSVRELVELLKTSRATLFFRATHSLSSRLRLLFGGTLEATTLRLAIPSPDEREEHWRQILTPHLDAAPEALNQLAFSSRTYPFGVVEIEAAFSLAKLYAAQRDPRKVNLTPADVEGACQSISGQTMNQLAQRVSVRATWDDVVLVEETRKVIDDMVTYGQFRTQVFEEQGYSKLMSYGQGLTALFWGPPGTGKTMVSGLVARELGLELYRIELSQVVSKYIGETEQRLARIFDEAVVSGMALLFDEADALFASRTEVKSSVDRYANLEVNFLLQRIEHHSGVVILTTNFPKSIDEAFMRRIRFKAEFPAPGQEERQRLWAKMIPEEAPQDDKLDFDYLGEVYEMTGGEIRNAVLRAAFYAAEEGAPLGSDHLHRAAQREYRETGRLIPGDVMID